MISVNNGSMVHLMFMQYKISFDHGKELLCASTLHPELKIYTTLKVSHYLFNVNSEISLVFCP